jgi:hypothetical protein
MPIQKSREKKTLSQNQKTASFFENVFSRCGSKRVAFFFLRNPVLPIP